MHLLVAIGVALARILILPIAPGAAGTLALNSHEEQAASAAAIIYRVGAALFSGAARSICFTACASFDALPHEFPISR